MKQCDKCEGTGKQHPACENCGSHGWVYDEEDGGTMDCPECDGDSADECEACEGYGTLEE